MCPCNCIARCLRPCRNFKEHIASQKEKEANLKDKDPESIVIFEQALVKTSVYLSDKSAWATSGILMLACEATITNYNTFYGSWIFFIIILLFSLIYATFPQRLFNSNHHYKEIGFELENAIKTMKNINNNDIDNDESKQLLLNPNKDPTISDYFKLTSNKPKLLNNKNSNKTNNIDQKKYSIFDKSFILVSNMNILIMATFGNVIALSLFYAIKETMVKFGNKHYIIIAYWIAAIIITLITVYLIAKLAIYLFKYELIVMNHIIINGIESSKEKIISLQTRYIFCFCVCF